MAQNCNVTGGTGTGPEGQAKRQAKLVWSSVNTPSAWDALTAAAKLEIVRKFIKYSMMRMFGFQ